jgi:hypothetical protein
MAVRFSALRTSRTLLPRNIFLLLVQFMLEAEPQGLMLPDGLGKLKKFIHRIGSRTRDLLACGIVL